MILDIGAFELATPVAIARVELAGPVGFENVVIWDLLDRDTDPDADAPNPAETTGIDNNIVIRIEGDNLAISSPTDIISAGNGTSQAQEIHGRCSCP